MFLKLDQEGLLYSQVYRALRRQILSGRMRPGSRLPSTRWLASELGISRNTALLAYEQLVAEGYLTAGSHAGTKVASELPENLTFVAPNQVSRKHAIPSAVRLSSFASRIADDPVSASAIREILFRPALPYDFRYGRPSFADFPHAIWDRTLARRARQRSIGDLDYGAPEGMAPLRSELAEYLRRARAVNCSPEQIIIVSGSQQAIDLAVRVLVDRGDRVVLENPHYFPARNVSRAAGARIEFVDVDEQGMKIGDLAAKRGRVKLVFVTPSHQFPTGALMPLGRRLELLAWANRTGAVVFEDDYDSEYRYSGRPVEALQALDESGRVLYSGTFSKTMFPGLRLGYLVVPTAARRDLPRGQVLARRRVPYEHATCARGIHARGPLRTASAAIEGAQRRAARRVAGVDRAPSRRPGGGIGRRRWSAHFALAERHFDTPQRRRGRARGASGSGRLPGRPILREAAQAHGPVARLYFAHREGNRGRNSTTGVGGRRDERLICAR